MAARRGGRLYGLVSSLGGATLGLFQFVGGLALLFRDTLGHALKGPFQGRPVGAKAFWTQAVRVGPRSLAVVFTVNLFVGMILALIGGKILGNLGVTEYVGDLIGVGVVLELGPLLTGIIMTGYIGAALTAEIGTMVVSEEITALRTMSLNPVRFVVAPRLLAVLLMVPCVTLLGDFVGIAGGALVSSELLGVSTNSFLEHAWDSLYPEDVWRGLIKSGVFGLIIGTVGCYQGFQVKGGAEGVGRVTTNAVVTSIIAIIVSDAILNYILLFRL
jgi:phospholipid/cholesterol/gamma-HCH transport system permease protein